MNTKSSISEIKSLVPISTILRAYGSEADSKGNWPCLFSERHTNGDAHPSVTVKDYVATCWSQKCFEQADVFQLVGLKEGIHSFAEQKKRVLELAGIHKTNGNGQGPGKILVTYDYTDEAGTLLHQVCRFDPKDFRQRRPDGKGGWIWNLRDARLVLYRLPEVLNANHVLIVEGEKDVETAYCVGLPSGWAATCNPMGAGKWREEYSTYLKGKKVVILPDADEPGRRHGEQVTQALHGKAKRVDLLKLPDDAKDLSDWATGKTGADLADLLTGNSIHAYRPHPLHESNFHPVPVSELLATTPQQVSWVLDDYLAQGGLVLVAGKPKEGKSTLVYELVVKVAQGLPFLGRESHETGVLILAVEESQTDVQLRLHNLGADTLDNLYVHVGPSESNPTVFTQIIQFVQRHHIRLIVVDTLANFWRVQNENDASEVTQAVKPLLHLARQSGACVLLIHHARKSEGSYGDEIRGSGALFAAVDVALILKRHEVQTQRLLQAQSRYPETPSELVLELRETGYVALGDPASTGKAAKLTKLSAALTDEWEDAETIAKRAALSYRERYRLLDTLVTEGKALRDGKGVKGEPFRFRKNSIHAGGHSIEHESNSRKADSIHAAPPSPCTNGIPAEECQEEINLDAN